MTNRVTSKSSLLINISKQTILGFLFLSLFIACGNETTTDNGIDKTEEIDIESNQASTMDPRSFGGEKAEGQVFIDEQANFDNSNPVLGMFMGTFGNNMINIVITYAENGTARGYSVCAGNFRRLTGTYEIAADGLSEFKLEEPGDDQYDGAFEFITNGEDLSGKWTPFKEKGNSPKNYFLIKKTYKYDKNNGDHTGASTRLLKEDDVNNLNGEELAYMRNCIYARHGYSFKDKMYRRMFEKLDWYMPTCIDVRDKLSENEVANIELIYQYEDYFEMYYDDYGR
jgi:hypothetical protein